MMLASISVTCAPTRTDGLKAKCFKISNMLLMLASIIVVVILLLRFSCFYIE